LLPLGCAADVTSANAVFLKNRICRGQVCCADQREQAPSSQKTLSPQFFEQLLRLAIAVDDGGTKSREITCGEGACSRSAAQQT
jgi:hypothetical protein